MVMQCEAFVDLGKILGQAVQKDLSGKAREDR
jgi:hypothetical protein